MSEVIKNLNRQRTLNAFQWISSLSAKKLKDYLPTLRGLPVALRTQGLVVVCATLLKRGDERDGERVIADMIARWLRESELPLWESDSAIPQDGRALLKWVVNADNSRYRAAQREALAYAEQLKLLAEAWHRGEQ